MRNLRLGIVLLFLFQLGVSAPQNSSEAPKTSRTTKTKGTSGQIPAMTPQSVGDEIVKFFGRKTGKELMAEKAGNITAAGAATAKVLAGKSFAKASAVKPLGAKSVPPPPTPRVAVPQIRQEIQKILDLNKKIQKVQTGRSVQLQRVQEQARIHQKILNELEVSQKQTAGQKVPEKNSLLAQEKLRIIHEETQRNAKAIDDLQENPAGATVKEISQTVVEAIPEAGSKVKTAAS